MFDKELASLKKDNLYRNVSVSKGFDFSSNDYLGLSSNEVLRSRVISCIETEKSLGSSSSRLIRGNHSAYDEVERYLAKFLNREASLIFNSGYSANEGVISTICRDGVIFSDELNHASIIDGIKLSKSDYQIFRHADLSHLRNLLEQTRSGVKKYIIVESLYSMDGDIFPLRQLLDLCREFDAWAIIDEAHATGVFGDKGEGLLGQFHGDLEKVISIHTCGKALGGMGAFIGCTRQIRNYLINKCRQFIYTTALPPWVVRQIQLSIEFVQEFPKLREDLFSNVELMQRNLDLLKKSKIYPTQIMPLILGESERALNWSKELLTKGLDVKAIRYPTVPNDKARLRISIHSNHREEDIRYLNDSLREISEKEKGEYVCL